MKEARHTSYILYSFMKFWKGQDYILRQSRLVVARSQGSGRGPTARGHQGTFRTGRNVPHLDSGGGYMIIFKPQQNCMLKIGEFL